MTRFVRLTAWTVALLAGLGAIAWFVLLSPIPASPGVEFGCDPDGVCVTVDEDGSVTASPGGEASTGLIVYTGARVDPSAYVPVAVLVAEQGYPVFVPRLTLNFAIFDADAADEVVDAHPEVERWVIAGHSLGGVMAARYAASHPETVDGLVLWGSYPEESLDLTDSGLVVASVYGSEDGLTTPSEALAARAVLPSDVEFVEIHGGNHAQFGDYGEQRGDLPARIAPDEQWRQVAGATGAVLAAVAG